MLCMPGWSSAFRLSRDCGADGFAIDFERPTGRKSVHDEARETKPREDSRQREPGRLKEGPSRAAAKAALSYRVKPPLRASSHAAELALEKLQ